MRNLQLLADAKDEADIKGVLGDPNSMPIGELTPKLVEKLKKRFADDTIHSKSNTLQSHWVRMDVAKTRKSAQELLQAVKAHQQSQGSLSLNEVKGKPANKVPSHFEPGKLPAGNVAALGRTLFTDYLIAVELAATLLLVATIGAIAIAGRRSEELR